MLGVGLALPHTLEDHWRTFRAASAGSDEFMLDRLARKLPEAPAERLLVALSTPFDP
ncbi:hypothetical protein MPRM_05650 [Mycobacterium parmense]|uniref:Uncharacterized protein n=1 Tax=Mycobacterium parmense TaxID=185642 RepID=A0A7I7YQ52_9MYCO|nr:hypothetical protein MPRM_05650 [Mycobacterium parmense]